MAQRWIREEYNSPNRSHADYRQPDHAGLWTDREGRPTGPDATAGFRSRMRRRRWSTFKQGDYDGAAFVTSFKRPVVGGTEMPVTVVPGP